jgi:hypothetical protein
MDNLIEIFYQILQYSFPLLLVINFISIKGMMNMNQHHGLLIAEWLLYQIIIGYNVDDQAEDIFGW